MQRNPSGLTGFLRAVFGFIGESAVRSDLVQSRQSGVSVRIRYKNNRGGGSEREIDVLATGNGYVDAFDHSRQEIRTFRISRVKWTELTDAPFVISAEYVPSGWVRSGRGEIRR